MTSTTSKPRRPPGGLQDEILALVTQATEPLGLEEIARAVGYRSAGGTVARAVHVLLARGLLADQRSPEEVALGRKCKLTMPEAESDHGHVG
jgi:DNA-binding IclR family transcriptional regulator